MKTAYSSLDEAKDYTLNSGDQPCSAPQLINNEKGEIAALTHLGTGSSKSKSFGVENSRVGDNFVSKANLEKYKAIYLKARNNKTGRFLLRIDKSGSDKSLYYIQVTNDYNGFWSEDARVSGLNGVFPASFSNETEFDVYGTNDAS
ncbi:MULTISPECIES: hypothetical protein [unclassified Pseudomonas]|uniref:hypothetical protein n=1 Tax=unclassified Pseudomonas TaxID=196821 RepID=UPI002096AF34|nr:MULTISPECIES: hypothetical protein [unclassified Pseudomonas]MCO7519108.1 hypothetical protein [Pseudomonas sp. 1]MCO7540062.1 hypothetical protein [Pseudomonas sp. VA159-2]